MKKIVVAVLAIMGLSLVACNKINNSPLNQKISYEYKAEVDKKLVKKVDTISDQRIYERYVIEDGDKLVFTLSILKDDPNAYDDEYADIVRFEVPKDATTFSYDDNTLINGTAVYNAWGAWGGVSDVLINDGHISGKKVGDKAWDVQVFVNVPKYNDATEMKNIEKTYRVEL